MEVLHTMMDQVERQRLSKMVEEMPDHVTMQQRHASLSLCTLTTPAYQMLLLICFVH